MSFRRNGALPLFRFETPFVAGKPAAIPARFATPSAAETTLRSARLAELVEGSLSSLRQGDTVQLPLPDNRTVAGRINVVQHEADGQIVVGGVLTGGVTGTFSLGEDESRLGGVIIPTDGSIGYQIETGRDGAAYLLEKNKGSIVCVELPVMIVSSAVVRDARRGEIAQSSAILSEAGATAEASAPEYLLSSRPTAVAVAYLDFDGETVTDSYWNSGNVIDASSAGFSAAQITEVWQRVTEDYRPFNIDVTTDRSRYDNAPAGSRIRCIITQSSSWYGSAGGVAYIGSWSASGSGGMSSTIPCWVFANLLSLNPRYVAEAVSHEIGHTLGLSHDGLNSPSGGSISTYYSGHGTGDTSWAPIMGSGYYKNVVQWSNGNYSTNGNVGNNTENDLAIISDSRNHAGYMTDDTGGTLATASALSFSSGSTVSTVGLAERTGDVDMYSFTTSGGAVTFALAAEFSDRTGQSNLDARATLYDASGNALADANPTGSLYPSISTTVSAGTYYIAITAVGEGDVPGTGYTNYASLGRYEITGSVASSALQPPLITSRSSGSAVRGASFSHQVTASNSPSSYGASNLPSGLSINASSGLVSGTVSTSVSAGSYTVTLTATNASGSGSQSFTLTISDPLPSPPAITSASTGSVTRGSSFSHQVTATNSPTSYAASGLPSGLSINTSTGLISGTVSSSATTGVYSVALTATNAGGSGAQTFALTVNAPLPAAPVITSASSGSAVTGASFSHQIVASNSPTSYNASGLPSGLSINTSSGLISGTVSSSAAAGAYPLMLTATNAGGSGTQSFSLTLSNPLPSAPVISSASTASGVTGSAFTYQIVASNSPTSYNATGLPSGLSINTSSGLISGTISSSASAGVLSITLTATNAGGSGTKLLSLTLSNPLPSAPVISSASSASGVTGSAFTYQIVASNLPTSYNASGLPSGLSVNTSNGLISGTISSSASAGVVSVTLTATNAGGSGTKLLSLTLSNPLPSAPVISSASSASGVTGSAFTYQIVASNLPTSYNASGLPSGLSVNTSNGLISGTISSSASAGVVSVTLTATNAGGSGTKLLSLTLSNPLPSAPVISSASSASGVTGSAFTYQIVASNSPTSYNATGLPSGLSINTSSGLISGTISSSASAGVVSITLTATNAGGSGTKILSLTLSNPLPSAPVISSVSTASGVTGSAFTYQIVASNSPTSYNASGLPSGLSINTSSGLISGTISSSASAGVVSITLTATNAGGSGTKILSLTLSNPLPSAPVISSVSTASGVTGSAFTYQIVASNSPTSYNASGLPSGLSINTSSGQIYGTISSSASAGVVSITLSAFNAGGSGTKVLSLTLTKPLPSAPVITSAGSGSAVVGSAFSHQVAASNSPTSYAASGLPSGLSINSTSGLISGTISSGTAAKVYSVTIVATNAGGSGAQTFALTVTNPIPSAPVISSSANAGTMVGSPFSYLITASNSPTSYNASGLPSGLSINASTGVISGTVPNSVSAGLYSVTLTATNAGGSGTKVLSLTVTVPALPVPVITSAASARAVLETDFSFQVVATNAPTSYAALGLPAGLTINSATGIISGAPAATAATGLYAVTVTATNASGTGSQVLGLEVKSAFAAWAQDKQVDDITSASTADPDGDGIGNLLEYAFDLSPSSPDSTSLTEVGMVKVNGTPRMEITFVRPANRPDLIYTVEVSSNMQTWSAGHSYGANVTNGSGLPTQQIERTSLGTAGERIRVRDIGGVGMRFIRVRVTSL